MVELEIDGRPVSVPEGSMVMQAAEELGIFVPHFCYHRKLSIAANCRMCLVEVERAPKPLPACATPVTKGMKVYTNSEKAIAAQKSVMEFLLINHPLDCPICDQGGECQLQDLAVGYGGSESRYDQQKRVVFHKNLGPLVAAEEMTRCIQCTRCVRFGQEVAGQMEIGMQGRGEHSEIMSFLGRTIDSELSGNMIDVCPVGALTSKPFRYTARTWELRRRRSVAPHDSLGSNLVVQCRQDRVMRVLPFENEEINECWLSDRDRFSYEALNSGQRLQSPMLKQDGQWLPVGWDKALDYVTHGLSDTVRTHGADAVGAWLSPHGTTEELWLASKLVRALGSDNVDFRLRQTDFSGPEAPAADPAVPWLGMPVEQLGQLEGVLLVGSFVRKDHPLVAARLRVAARDGLRVGSLHAVAPDWAMPVQAQVVAAPDQWEAELQRLLSGGSALGAVFGQQPSESGAPGGPSAQTGPSAPAAPAGADAPVSTGAQITAVAQAVAEADSAVADAAPRFAILLGNAVVQHPRYAAILAAARRVAKRFGARVGVIGEAANSVGAHLVGARPRDGGHDVARMIASPRKAMLLMHVEPGLDVADGAAALHALRHADTVVALTSFVSPELLDVADCLLPVSPYTETGGSFVNAAGTVQPFQGVVRPLGLTRPAWKVLRVLGNRLELDGFDFEDVEQVRHAALGDAPPASRLHAWSAASGDRDGRADTPAAATAPQAEATSAGASSAGTIRAADTAPAGDGAAHAPASGATLQRIADVPAYFADMLVRRAPSLQQTFDARVPTLRVNGRTLDGLGLSHGGRATVRSAHAAPRPAGHDDRAAAAQPQHGTQPMADAITLVVERDDGVADGVARIAAAHPSTVPLGAMSGAVLVEAAQ